MKLAKIKNEILTNVSKKICRIVRYEIRSQFLDHTTTVENMIIRNSTKVSNIVHMQILQNIASEIKKIYYAGN